jgi:O-antigen/teichoic acid export membrane protein
VVGRWGGLWALENADRFVALGAFTLTVVGYYVAAARIASLVLSVNRALAGSLHALLHELAADPARHRDLARLHAGFAVLGLALASGAAAIFHHHAGAILGPRFHDAAPIIAVVILAAGCHAAFQAGWLVRGFYPLTRWSGLKTYVALALQVAVTLALLPALGVLAPAVGDVAGRLAASGIMTWAAFSCVGRLPIAAGRARAGVEPRDDDL